MVKDDRNQVRCSFCGKTEEQVMRLVAGPGVYICNECIELCSDIIFEEEKIDIVVRRILKKHIGAFRELAK